MFARTSIRSSTIRVAAALIAATLVAWGGVRAAEPMFRPDDPLMVDPDTVADAGGARPQELSQQFDFFQHTFGQPGDRRPMKAVNVNTLDEAPDSMWFVDRIMRGPLSDAQIVRGPDEFASLPFTDWVLVGAKNSGLQPGFRLVGANDSTRQVYQVEFDPPSNPELATGAEIIGTTLYHAIGYHVVQNYLVNIDPARVTIDPKATIRSIDGRRRRFTSADFEAVLRRSARRPDGTYRGLASRFAPGEPMGAFRYFGTRSDDPNDIYPHEHRRELRGARVFGAWVNHDDSRSNNTLDMREGPKGAQYIRHYMFDFGSIMGSGTTGPDVPRSGHEYLLERDASLRALATLGLWAPTWARTPIPPYAPSAGPFFAEDFDVVGWRPEYPNPAFENMDPADAFWGARRVAAFSDRQLDLIVGKAAYTDRAAHKQIVSALIGRRDAIARTWLVGVTPLVNASLSAKGTLTFDNAAVTAGVASPPEAYVIQWSRFDNASRTHTPTGDPQRVGAPQTVAPAAILDGNEPYVCATVSVTHPDFPHWSSPVEFYFRREGAGWKPVGLIRR